MQPAPLLDQPARFAIMGVLAESAHVLVRPDGRVQLQVLIAQRVARMPEAKPILATHTYPDGNSTAAQLAARQQAARMPAGAEVIATGSALHPGQHMRAPVLVLADVEAIVNHPISAPSVQPERYP